MKLKLFDTIRIPFVLVGIFWAVKLAELAWGDISYLGVAPRSLHGLIGIFLMPFLHGDFSHLFSNTPSFLILCGSIIYFYPKVASKTLIYSYLLTGIGVWLFARSESGIHQIPVHHIGASGLVYAYAAFLFFIGIFRREPKTLSISLAVAVLYYGMLQGLVPTQPGISWESHLIGAVIGSVLAFVFKNVSQADDNEYIEPELITPDEGYRNIETEYIKYVYKENP